MDRLKRFLPYIGYGVFYFVAFFFACYWTFPYDRLRDRLVAEFASDQKGKANAQQRISIESLEPYWLSGWRARGVKLTMSSSAGPRMNEPEEPPTEIEIEDIHARLGIFARLFGTNKVTFAAHAFGGDIDGVFTDTSADRHIEVNLKDVSISRVEPIVKMVGLPMVGSIDGKIDLQFAEKRASKAEGTINLTISDLSVGDGQAKIKGALALPKMNAGELTMDLDVASGVAKINKLSGKGTDLELAAEGKISVRDQPSDSSADVNFRFKFTDAYRNRNDVTRSLFGAPGSTAPALFELADPKIKQSKRASDGFYVWRVSGMLSNPRFDPAAGAATTPGAPPTPAMRSPAMAPPKGGPPNLRSARGCAEPPREGRTLMRVNLRFPRVLAIVLALVVARVVPAWWCGRDADAWFRGDPERAHQLAEELVAFEVADDASPAQPSKNRFVGEWALVTHQMTALGLAQLCLVHPEWRERYVKIVTRAATKSFRPEMRDFGTKAWHGEDALASLGSPHGHAYLAYSALALGMARLLDPSFPAELAAKHDALIAAYERRLLASPTGLIETYPGEAYPTDVAAVAAAIAVHGRVTGSDHHVVLAHWAERLRSVQIDKASGLVIQRLGAQDGRPHDAPRGSGTALAAYFAGFADRSSATMLADAVFQHESTLFGFGAIREYASGHHGVGDIDSGPVLLGVSVSATGFALAPARALGRRDDFVRIYRTTDLFGLPVTSADRFRFAVGGPIGNALLLAFLTSGPELAP